MKENLELRPKETLQIIEQCSKFTRLCGNNQKRRENEEDMKAVLWPKYGEPEVLEYGEVETPVPKDNEVLIKIHATTVTLGDCEIRGSYLPLWTRIPLRLIMGVFKPRGMKMLGQECAGEIVEIGKDVTKFEIGDRVVVISGLKLSTYAEYMTMREKGGLGMVVKMHPDISYQHATTLPVGGLNGMYFINRAEIKEGEEVLINGAAGSIGSYAIQVAKMQGAIVTAIDLEEKFDLLQQMGADHCMDFTQTDFTRKEKSYDVIFDVVGKASFRRAGHRLNSGGRYLTANPMPNTMIRSAIRSRLTDKTYVATVVSESSEDLEHLMQLVVDKKLQVPIDKTYRLEEAVEAHRYIETGMKKGHVILTPWAE